MYRSPQHISGITGNILIMIIGFARHYLLLASNSTFMTDSQYLGTLEIWQNFNEYYLTSTESVICQIGANCSPLHYAVFSHQAKSFKTDLIQFNIKFF